jgi:Cdc6-like AAA superfamily ATPase
MSRKIIQDVIQQFIDSKVPQVLAVTGAWGVGKTFALKQIVESYTGSQSLGRYSYASVFGAQSIVEVRTLLLAKTRVFPIKRDVNSGFRAGLEKQVGKFRVREAVDQLKEMIPFGGKHVVVALETVAGSFLKDTIIVLDDIERHSDKVKLEDLLGLVSELKEQAGKPNSTASCGDKENFNF